MLGVVAMATVIGNAFVAAFAEADPDRAASVWGRHPDVLVSQGLTEIGLAAVKHQPPPAGALAAIDRAGRLSPLLHDPFLIRGIDAQQAGDLRRAEQAFAAARKRAPREAAPRYFLSELYLTSGRGRQGLGELATLARLLPNGPVSVAPSLAAYARSSGDLASLKATFRKHPELEQAVLVELSKDPANADIAMRLANRLRDPDGKAADWVEAILPRLADAGQIEKAHQLWQMAGGTGNRGRIFDPGFSGSKAPPPFNWSFRSDSSGFAEPDGKGGLHVLFYGREDAGLANQILLLAPGRYRLAMRVSGNPGRMLRWSLTCLPGKQIILNLSLGAAASGSPAGEFTVPGGCSAQRLDLAGESGELPRQADVTISELTLAGGRNGA